MSEKIKIDPENLETMSVIMENATDAMDEAVQLMLQIVTHRDWTCRERYTINDKIEEIQKAVKLILEWGGSFAKVVRQVLKRLKEKEKRISGIFETIDSIIGRIIGIRPSTIIETGRDIINQVTDNRDSTGTPAVDSTIGRAVQEALQTVIGTTTDTNPWGQIPHPNWEPIYGSNGEIIGCVKSASVSDLSTVAEPISTVDFGSLEL